MRAGDHFPESVRRRLRDRVNNLCSNPGCGRQTTGPHHNPEKAITIGRAAHITAARARGPRFNASLSQAERGSALNGIWLCTACHDVIDADDNAFPVSLLREWKENAETAARAAICVTTAVRNTTHVWLCPRCGNSVEHGLLGCWRCGAEMVYGLSRREREEWLKVGFSAGALASGVALLNLPGWLNSTLGFTVAKYFGGAGAIIGGIIFVASGGGFVLFAELAKRRKPPRFFWQSFS